CSPPGPQPPSSPAARCSGCATPKDRPRQCHPRRQPRAMTATPASSPGAAAVAQAVQAAGVTADHTIEVHHVPAPAALPAPGRTRSPGGPRRGPHPEQGWSLLCNGVVAFDDTGALLPNGRSIPPHQPAHPNVTAPLPRPGRLAVRGHTAARRTGTEPGRAGRGPGGGPDRGAQSIVGEGRRQPDVDHGDVRLLLGQRL